MPMSARAKKYAYIHEAPIGAHNVRVRSVLYVTRTSAHRLTWVRTK